MTPQRLACALVACLSSDTLSAAQSPAPAPNPLPRLQTTSVPRPAHAKTRQFFTFDRKGLIADGTFIAASLSGGSAMSEQSKPKTVRVIKDAFDSAGVVDLTLLDFTFVGSSKAAARVEKLVKAVRGRFATRLKLDP